MPKKQKDEEDVQDWRDDVLTAIEFTICVVLGFMFYSYLSQNPDVAALLQPDTLGMFILSFGLFVGIFLFVKWLNRKVV